MSLHSLGQTDLNIQVEPYISAEEILQINQELAQTITQHYASSKAPLIVVGLLRGSFIFMADLVRHIKLPLITDFMTVSSYGNQQRSSGNVKIVMDLDETIDGCDVLLVEDIVDTGNTLACVVNLLQARNPHSIKVVSLLDKPSRREVKVVVDFCGRQIEDQFVVGYGLDFAQKFRNLPYIGLYTGSEG